MRGNQQPGWRLSVPLFMGLLALGSLGVQPALAQAVRVDEPGVCFQCHSDIETQAKERHVHTAFRGGKCSGCHNPHAASHAALLKEDEGKLCRSCHEEIEAELEGVSVHPPAAGGQCGSCHEPHASAQPNQLNQPVRDLCASCHPSSTDWPKRKVVHRPVAQGDCGACHRPHGSQAEHLTKSEVPALCFGCHAQDSAFTAAHRGRPIAGSNCAACHDPHASDNNNLLRANQHAPFAGGACDACHEGGGTPTNPFAITGGVKPVCYGCHPSIEQAESEPHHAHLTDPDACASCHNPHASNETALLAAKQSVMCFRCHFRETGEKPRSAFLTHEGLDCTNCHTPHGAGNPRYLLSVEIDLCERCHADAHVGGHPVGEDVVDPRSDEPMTCISCHQLHGADFEKYLPLDPGRELCLQCHRK